MLNYEHISPMGLSFNWHTMRQNIVLLLQSEGLRVRQLVRKKKKKEKLKKKKLMNSFNSNTS